MREFVNKTSRNLSYEEHKAILEAAKILEDAFHRNMHQVILNPHSTNADDVWGISFGFDMMDISRKKK